MTAQDLKIKHYEEWLERAAIMEYDGEMGRDEAESRALLRLISKYKEDLWNGINMTPQR